MNNFTKEELKTLHEMLDNACEDYRKPNSTYELRDKIQDLIDNNSIELRDKIQYMIDDYSIENEIFSCHSALAVSDEFFCQQQYMMKDDLLPIIYNLVSECHGIINKSGIYDFKLRIVKIK